MSRLRRWLGGLDTDEWPARDDSCASVRRDLAEATARHAALRDVADARQAQADAERRERERLEAIVRRLTARNAQLRRELVELRSRLPDET